MSKTTKLWRDAGTGRFVTKKYASEYPDTTTGETFKHGDVLKVVSDCPACPRDMTEEDIVNWHKSKEGSSALELIQFTNSCGCVITVMTNMEDAMIPIPAQFCGLDRFSCHSDTIVLISDELEDPGSLKEVGGFDSEWSMKLEVFKKTPSGKGSLLTEIDIPLFYQQLYGAFGVLLGYMNFSELEGVISNGDGQVPVSARPVIELSVSPTGPDHVINSEKDILL